MYALLVKSNKIAHMPGYALHGSRWHKVGGDTKPTNTGHAEGKQWVMPLDAAIDEHKELVRVAATPSKADDKAEVVEQKQELARMEDAAQLAFNLDAQPTKPSHHAKLDMMRWDRHVLPDSNTNATSHNKKVARIKSMAYAGDLAGLEAFKAGTNTYGRKQNLLARTAAAAIRESAPALAATEDAAHAAATSPHNDEPLPTQAQIEAGNYKKGHINFQGLDITVENPRGSERSGNRPDGSVWKTTMSDHYGYFKRAEGADGDNVDVYVGPHMDADTAYVIDQTHQGTGKFDEHKVMLGYASQDEAVAAYAKNYDEGWKVGPITAMKIADLKHWLENGGGSHPLSNEASEGPREGERNAEGLVFRDGRWHNEEPEIEPEPEAVVDDGLSDDPNSPNYRFRDTGHISGSRKELAAGKIRLAAKSGQRVRSTDIDWDGLEENSREAEVLINKSNLFGSVDWQALREGGMEPGAAFLIDRVYAAAGSMPSENNPRARKDYAIGLESLRDRLERCKTHVEVIGVLEEIRDEFEGVTLNEKQAARYKVARDSYRSMMDKAREAESVLNGYSAAANAPMRELNNAKYEQQKRLNRGWKPDPKLDEVIERAQTEYDAAIEVWQKYKDAHPELISKERKLHGGWTTFQNDLEFAASKHRDIASGIVADAKRENLLNNQSTRSWLTMGDRFMSMLFWRSSKGSDAFSGHVTNVKNGKVKDWSWAEGKQAGVKKATKREVGFQLKVAENFERKGGRNVTAKSTQEFKEQFNLHEVQSGNWVLNDQNSAAWHVQRSTEAFADLADIIGVQDADVSMNGKLSMAFGARGHGNAGWRGAARAHYEGVQRVINLTKMGGGGSLGHEWAHAMDNIIAEAATGKPQSVDTFCSETPDVLPPGDLRDAFMAVHKAMHSGEHQVAVDITYAAGDVRKADYNIKNAFSGVARSIRDAGSVEAAVAAVEKAFAGKDMSNRKNKNRVRDWKMLAVAYYDRNDAGSTVAVKSGPGVSAFVIGAIELDGAAKSPYWASTREMFARAFQSYVEDKLASQDRRNDYLSSMADNKYHVDIFGQQWKPFPEGEERTRINEAFDKLMGVIAKENLLAKAALLL